MVTKTSGHLDPIGGQLKKNTSPSRWPHEKSKKFKSWDYVEKNDQKIEKIRESELFGVQ